MNLYRLHAALADGVSAKDHPWPCRTVGRELEWTFAAADFHRIPEVRRWIAAHGGAILDESGDEPPTASFADGNMYLLFTGTRYTQTKALVGIAEVREPCPGCSLSTRTLVTTGEPLRFVGPEPRGPVVRLPWPGVWMVTKEMHALFEGSSELQLLPVSLGRRATRWLLMPTHRIDGFDYRFGPEPCARCGRAERTYAHGPDFVSPRYSMAKVLSTPTISVSAATDWCWHALYGPGLPLASARAARRLAERAPGLTGLRLPMQMDDTAYLPLSLR
jgi:hypothetical protein